MRCFGENSYSKIVLARERDAIISQHMQRSILSGLVIAAIMIIMVGAGAGYWGMRQNRPDQRWVPLPLNPNSSAEDRNLLQQQLDAYLRHDELLQKVIQEMGLVSRWDADSDQACLQKLKSSLFVRQSETQHPMTQQKILTMDIGVNGKRKEVAVMADIAVRLSKEASSYMGLGRAPQ